MCLAVFSLGGHERIPFVLAANRDEAFARPTAPLGWWPGTNRPAVLGGRDLQGGGTWLALSTAGRLALVTNVRAGLAQPHPGPSRGALAARWLTSSLDAEGFWQAISSEGYRHYNLIGLDFNAAQGHHWFSSTRPAPQTLPSGLHGLSNGLLNEAWPKVARLRREVASALDDPDATAPALCSALLAALRHEDPAPDASLPSTGVPLEIERRLSPAFIRASDGRYGTRCSTVIVTLRDAHGTLVTTVAEQTYDANGEPAGLRCETLPNWPNSPQR